MFGRLGDRAMAQTVLTFHSGFIDDRGICACSDLNPYMLGFSARGLNIPTQPKIVLGMTEFAEYGGETARPLDRPTAYVVNPHHPIARDIDFPLEETQ